MGRSHRHHGRGISRQHLSVDGSRPQPRAPSWSWCPKKPTATAGGWCRWKRFCAEAADPRTRLVTLSHVEFASGQRHDLARIGKFCREQPKAVLRRCHPIAGRDPGGRAGDAHRLSLRRRAQMDARVPRGAGIFYCRRELMEHTRPLMIGWMNVVDAQNYGNYDYTLHSDAGRFECGTTTSPACWTQGLDAIADRFRHQRHQPAHQTSDRPPDPRPDGQRVPGGQPASSGLEWSASSAPSRPKLNHQEIFIALPSSGSRSHYAKADSAPRRIFITPKSKSTGCWKRCRCTDGTGCFANGTGLGLAP